MKNKKLIVSISIIIILVIAFFAGGKKDITPTVPEEMADIKDAIENIESSSENEDFDMHEEVDRLEKEIIQRIEEDILLGKSEKKDEITVQKSTIDIEEEKDKYQTDPIPKGKPKPVEEQEVNINKDKQLTATLFVTCETILNNLDIFDEDKLEVLPEDGIIYGPKEVTFFEGESVFDVLLREMKGNNIHMEFEMTPIYNSNYVAGINNIYEFDCGELSGWMYKVNGWFPNYGASRYQVQDGDIIEWIYTCDLGRDIGGGQPIIGGDD